MFKDNPCPTFAKRSKSFFSGLDSLARETGLIQRTSKKFSASGLVIGLLKAVQSGKGSFNQLAMAMGLSEKESCTPQAIWKRVDRSALHFMIEVTSRALAEKWGKEQLIASTVFKRVIIEDSTQVKLPAANHDEFGGHGNGNGDTAGCKFDFTFDLLTGEVLSDSLHLATDQDRELGKDIVDLAEENDLFLRDMGYFGLNEFARIEESLANWLSRLPANVTACDGEDRKLETILRTAKGDVVEFDAKVGKADHTARLIAVRADQGVVQQRRRERRTEARKLGKTASQDKLARDGWHIMITNVGEEVMGAGDLFELYRVRWQIETTFRAWKQSCHLEEALKRHSNTFHLQCLMYGAILMLILMMKTAASLQARYRDCALSIEKIADSLTTFIQTLTSSEGLSAYNPDPRHLKMDRRARKSLHQIDDRLLS